MPTHSSKAASSPQESSWLIARTYAENHPFFKVCPRGRVVTGWSQTLADRVYIATKCGTWQCPYCGPRKQFQMGIKCELAQPNRLITLTLRTSSYENPRAAFDQSRRQVSELAKVLRRDVGEFEYLRVLEATKAGWPHYHLVARCPFIKQHVLSRLWRGLSGAPIVDIRQIDQRQGIFNYVCKYLSKQISVPWTKRRIAWTRNFFVKGQPDDAPGLELHGCKMEKQHIAEFFTSHCEGCLVQQIGTNLFVIKQRVLPHERSEGTAAP